MYEYVNDCPCGYHLRGKKKGKKISRGDCVIRAMQMAWGLKGEDGWRIASERLFARSLMVADTQIGDATWQSFCKQDKTVPRYQVNEDGSWKLFPDTNDPLNMIRKYYTVAEFAKFTKNHKKGYIVQVSKHLVYVKGGKYFDSWNSGLETVRSAWVLA